jgi:hypothetical protein
MRSARPALLVALAAAPHPTRESDAAAGRADQPSIKIGSAAAPKIVQPTVATLTSTTVASAPVATAAAEPVEPAAGSVEADESVDEVVDEPAGSAPVASSSGRPAPASTSKAVADADRAIDEADALIATDV